MQNLIIPRESLEDLSVKAAILYGLYLQRAEDDVCVSLSQGEIADILHITKKTAGKYQHELLDKGYIKGCSMTGVILSATVKKPERRGYYQLPGDVFDKLSFMQMGVLMKLYARAALSKKNGRTEEAPEDMTKDEERVWMIYRVTDIEKELDISHDSASKALKALCEKGYCDRVQIAIKKPAITFMCPIKDTCPAGTLCPACDPAARLMYLFSLAGDLVGENQKDESGNDKETEKTSAKVSCICLNVLPDFYVETKKKSHNTGADKEIRDKGS